MCDSDSSSDSGSSGGDYSSGGGNDYSSPTPSYSPPAEPAEDYTRHDPEPTYPTGTEILASHLVEAALDELLDHETYAEYSTRTGRTYQGKKQSGSGRNRHTSVPGKNLATTVRVPSPSVSPSKPVDEVSEIDFSNPKKNLGTSTMVFASLLAILGLMLMFALS